MCSVVCFFTQWYSECCVLGVWWNVWTSNDTGALNGWALSVWGSAFIR